MNSRRRVTGLLTTLLIATSLLCPAWPSAAELRAHEGTPAGLSAGEWQSIAAQIRERPYRLEPAAGGGYRAANPAQGWTVAFDADGVGVRAAAADWTWKLQLVSYGYPGSERAVSTPARLSAAGTRVDYDWGQGLTEWWRNGPDGVKQTFELTERPASADPARPLAITVRVAGSLQARLAEAGQAVSFTDPRGEVRLHYRELVVTDAAGRRIPAWFETTDDRVRLRVDDREARYPLTVDPIAQQAYLKASNAGAGDTFGNSVAISGDTVVVGATGEASVATGVNGNPADNTASGAGAAYVFVRSGGVWSQQAYLKASNTDAGDLFGFSVAISGDTVVVGAPNEASAATGVNGNQADNLAAFAGAAYVFVRSGTVWSQQAYLKASNTATFDGFGHSVAISGDTVVVGANNEASAATGVNGDQGDNTAPAAGAAYVFVRSGGVWSQQAYLKASNTDAGDQFGFSVAISGDTVVVGAALEASPATGVNGNPADNTAANAGAAYVFVRTGTVWSQQAYLKASNTDADDRFGSSVAVVGDTVVVGAVFEASAYTGVNGFQADNSAAGAGAAYVFTGLGPPRVSLAVVKAGSGSGTVTSSPAGIDCGASCTTDFLAGSTVTLTGTPAMGSVLREFTGGGCSGAEPCPVTLTGPTTVTAKFAGGLVNVAVNRPQFTGGTTVDVAVSVNNPTGLLITVNFLVGALLPDHETILFITGSGFAFGRLSDPTTWQPIAAGVSLATPLVLTVADFLVQTWTGAEPHGSYLWFLAAQDTATGGFLGVSTAATVLGP